MAKNNTFWNIISTNDIVIPTIQRDYAYGRREAKAILYNLLDSIVEVLGNQEASPIHLAFVYGKLDGKQNDQVLLRNAENIRALLSSVKEYAYNLDIEVDFDARKNAVRCAHNVKFIPIDGQQRLTTLFLLHWYLAVFLENNAGLKILKKFSYATRLSSKEFCTFLCDLRLPQNSPALDAAFVTNQEGFFNQWRNDPTVKNMLVVIDVLSKKLGVHQPSFQQYWKGLTEQERIYFDFFDLDNFQLTDELYVKMNARGKKLSEFEKFKAWLYHHLPSVEDQTKKRIDIEWFDLFWKARASVDADVDNAYLYWFKTLVLVDYLKEGVLESDTDLKDSSELTSYSELVNVDNSLKSVIAVLRSTSSSLFDLLQTNQAVRQIVLAHGEDYLQRLSCLNENYNGKLDVEINPLFLKEKISTLIFAENSSLNWWQLTMQYAIIAYASKYDFHMQSFGDYARVISNLIFNTTTDSPENFRDAVKSIDSIVTNCEGDIIGYLANESASNVFFFSVAQKEEEILKAGKCRLVQNGVGWETALIAAEHHHYFYGQIGFVFELMNDKNSLSEFISCYVKTAALFSEEVLGRSDYLLFRCFLSFGDCFIQRNDYKVFYSNNSGTLRIRNENWRRFFEQHIKILRQTIEHELFDVLNIEQSLISIIKDNCNKIVDPRQRLLVENEILFDYPRQNTICYSEMNLYLLNSSRFSGYFVEATTYLWYKTYIEKARDGNPDEIVKYNYVRGYNSDPGLILKFKDEEFLVIRNHNTGKYITQQEAFESDTIESIIEKIKSCTHAISN